MAEVSRSMGQIEEISDLFNPISTEEVVAPAPDTRMVACYNSSCDDYRKLRPHGTPCQCRRGFSTKKIGRT